MQTLRQDMVSPQRRKAKHLPHLQEHLLGHAPEKEKSLSQMKTARILVPILALIPFHDKYEKEIRKTGRQRWREWKREQRTRNGQKSGFALVVQALIWLLGLILFAVLISAINDLNR